ncbi:MAG: tetratricopeptide (TPR) repeat protein [Planctomycetota bacterium]|jgi:tetratricopeptide (TPR) repeat protein
MKSLLAIALAGAAMTPCLWDSDTLDTELRGLPDAFDLIVGKWHRHSDAYYQDRAVKLSTKSVLTLADYDDLAVAYEHLDKRDQAIEVMAGKAVALAAKPDKEHQYRYHANLGTFYAHAGKFDDALRELRTAVEINPGAHFGREVFQIELIEYVAHAKKEPEVWRLHSSLRHAGYYVQLSLASAAISTDPVTYKPRVGWNGTRKLDWDAAYKALAGMLRFGGLEGAELYRGMGELYLSKEHLNLAWWAYGRAIESGHPAAANLEMLRKTIESHWNEARPHKSTGHVNPTKADYDSKRAEADEWLARFQEAEAAAIARGEDVGSDQALKSLLDVANGNAIDAADDEQSSFGWRATTLISCMCLFGILFFLRMRAGKA